MRHYVLQIVGDVEPHLHGPFTTPEGRDAKAKQLRKEDPELKNGLFRVRSYSVVKVSSYAGGEFP